MVAHQQSFSLLFVEVILKEKVFYLRGNFPIERVVPVELVIDAKNVLSIESGNLNALAKELDSYTGFLDRSTISQILTNYLEDKEQIESISRLIYGVDSQYRVNGVDLPEFLKSLKEWQQSEENVGILSTHELEVLCERLPIIIKPYLGLKRHAKAKHLSSVLGNSLESIELICDVRPVFNEERSAIEGMIPYTTMKVVCTGVDGLPISIETVLPEHAVANLAKKATAAIQKLKLIRDMLDKQTVLIPALDITKGEV